MVHVHVVGRGNSGVENKKKLKLPTSELQLQIISLFERVQKNEKKVSPALEASTSPRVKYFFINEAHHNEMDGPNFVINNFRLRII